VDPAGKAAAATEPTMAAMKGEGGGAGPAEQGPAPDLARGVGSTSDGRSSKGGAAGHQRRQLGDGQREDERRKGRRWLGTRAPAAPLRPVAAAVRVPTRPRRLLHACPRCRSGRLQTAGCTGEMGDHAARCVEEGRRRRVREGGGTPAARIAAAAQSRTDEEGEGAHGEGEEGRAHEQGGVGAGGLRRGGAASAAMRAAAGGSRPAAGPACAPPWLEPPRGPWPSADGRRAWGGGEPDRRLGARRTTALAPREGNARAAPARG
jgi:hypothetical protein